MAFTSFDEEVKGSGSVMSTFMSDIDSLFVTALKTDGISGIIINPWNKTIMLDKRLISIIIGNNMMPGSKGLSPHKLAHKGVGL